jgi:SAM-dependent methyltransferase
MRNAAGGKGIAPGEGQPKAVRYYQRDFWSKENLKFSQPHYRMEKAVRIINGIARGRQCELLDVGCGPATLMHLLPPSVHYYGIDMAIQEQAPNLSEADIVKSPIGFAGKHFDIVLAQGVFEYVPEVRAQKFAEIAKILKPGGTFIVTYWNYAHRNPVVYHAHRNAQPVAGFRRDLARYFIVNRCFPASHNWYHGSPSMKLNKVVNMHLNVSIPLISRLLAVEYFFLCSPIGS